MTTQLERMRAALESLFKRIRPACEVAPWVYEELRTKILPILAEPIPQAETRCRSFLERAYDSMLADREQLAPSHGEELPALPEPDITGLGGNGWGTGFTADQMHAYAKAAIKQFVEGNSDANRTPDH